MSLAGEITVGALAALETAFNEALRLDPESLRKLAALQGRVIAIELRGTGLTLYLFPGPDGVVLLGEYAGEPDTVLSGTPLGLARLSLGDASGVLFAGEVTIRGDVETGQRFKAILDQLDLDWEEPLARLIGDIPAHRLGKLVRGTTDWARQAFETLGRNTAEYLEYEARALATREDVAEFVADVDRLRDDLARLEARMARL
ncbi:MAG TPA: sterol-binding protein, partial [Gammaproteobacteria bacterium]|nr:sterol-binding protein [Gammaproteobacteria bacterium]